MFADIEKVQKIRNCLLFALCSDIAISGFYGFWNIYSGAFELDKLTSNLYTLYAVSFIWVMGAIIVWNYSFENEIHNKIKYYIIAFVFSLIFAIFFAGYQLFLSQLITPHYLGGFTGLLFISFLFSVARHSDLVEEQRNDWCLLEWDIQYKVILLIRLCSHNGRTPWNIGEGRKAMVS